MLFKNHFRKKLQSFYYYYFFLHYEIFVGTNFEMVLCVCIFHLVIVIKQYVVHFLGLFFLWIVKERQHYYPQFIIKLKIHMQYVLCDVWCVMRDVPWFFCKILTLLVKGWPKYPICVVSGLLSDIPKLTPGGSRMYTLPFKAS